MQFFFCACQLRAGILQTGHALFPCCFQAAKEIFQTLDIAKGAFAHFHGIRPRATDLQCGRADHIAALQVQFKAVETACVHTLPQRCQFRQLHQPFACIRALIQWLLHQRNQKAVLFGRPVHIVAPYILLNLSAAVFEALDLTRQFHLHAVFQAVALALPVAFEQP